LGRGPRGSIFPPYRAAFEASAPHPPPALRPPCCVGQPGSPARLFRRPRRDAEPTLLPESCWFPPAGPGPADQDCVADRPAAVSGTRSASPPRAPWPPNRNHSAFLPLSASPPRSPCPRRLGPLSSSFGRGAGPGAYPYPPARPERIPSTRWSTCPRFLACPRPVAGNRADALAVSGREKLLAGQFLEPHRESKVAGSAFRAQAVRSWVAPMIFVGPACRRCPSRAAVPEMGPRPPAWKSARQRPLGASRLHTRRGRVNFDPQGYAGAA